MVVVACSGPASGPASDPARSGEPAGGPQGGQLSNTAPAGAPGCEEAVRAAAKADPALAEPRELAPVVAECIREEWSAEMRRCVAAAKDRHDLQACVARHDEQTKSRALQVTGLEPDRGDINGGTYVVIRGSRFLADGPRAAQVYFGTRMGIVVRFASDRELIVQAPGGKPGEVVDVLVIFEPGGQLKLPNAFTFVEKNEPN
jgi:hypothetical protein